jgi:Ca2+-binding RTX toxin-like protein
MLTKPTEYSSGLYSLANINPFNPAPTNPRSVSAIKLNDGRIAVEWHHDLQTGTDTLHYGIFDPRMKTFTLQPSNSMAVGTAETRLIGKGAANDLLLLNENTSAYSFAIQPISINGVTQRAATTVPNAAVMVTSEAFSAGGFGLVTARSISSSSTTQLDLHLVTPSGTISTIQNVLPQLTSTGVPHRVALAQLSDGAIVMAWGSSSTTAEWINVKIWNADRTVRKDTFSLDTSLAVSTGATWTNVGNNIHIAATDDGGFYLGRATAVQKFGSAGEAMSQRTATGYTDLQDLDVLADGSLFTYAKVSNDAFMFGVFKPGGEGPTATLTRTDSEMTRGVGPVIQMDDNTLVQFTPYASTLVAGYHAGATVVAEQTIFTPDAPRYTANGDYVLGTRANDRLNGLAGNDTLTGGNGADTLSGDLGNDVLRGDFGNDAIFGGAGADFLQGGAGNDILIGDGSVAESANALSIKRLYYATLNRGPDEGGWGSWTGSLDGGQSLSSIALGFVGSQEFKNTYGSLNNTQFVTLLYENVLKRAPDAGGLQGWTKALTGGTSRQDVVLGLSQSTEFIKATEISPHAGQIYRLYCATLARQPDAGGLQSWLDTLASGQKLESVAAGFVNSGEFAATYGNSLSSTQFITLLYQNVLGRAPDQAGLSSWLDSMMAGASRTSVVLGFSNSAEYVGKTDSALNAFMRSTFASFADTIDGGAGNDTLSGGFGPDTFVFTPGQGGSDVIHRFEVWDTLQFQGFSFPNLASAQASLAQSGQDVTFNAGGQQIIFTNTMLATVMQAQWLL